MLMLRLNVLGCSRGVASGPYSSPLLLLSSSSSSSSSSCFYALGLSHHSRHAHSTTKNRLGGGATRPRAPAPAPTAAATSGLLLLPRVDVRPFAVSRCRLSKETPGSPEDNKDRKDRHLPPSSRLRKVLPSLLAARPTAHENINTIPNWLTASRLVAAPFIGYCILHDHHAWTLGLFAYAGITDLLDGWIARRWNLGTVVGTIIDPMADKILMTVLCVALAAKGALPVWLAVIILGRDIALAISAIYYRWISLPPPKTFSRYWDFSLPSAEVRPTTISKYNTALQLGLMGMTTVAPVMPAVDFGTSLVVMQCVVAATTVWSGASYVFSKDAVKILHHPKPQPPAAERDNEETEKEHDKKEKKL